MSYGHVYLLDSTDAYGWCRTQYNIPGNEWDGKTAAIERAVLKFGLPSGTHRMAVVTPSSTHGGEATLGIFDVEVETTVPTVKRIVRAKA